MHKKIITAGYVQEYLMPLAVFSIMNQTAALLEVLCLLVSISNACSLLLIFNCLYPIFTFVLAPRKFTGICEVTQLTLGVFISAFEFGSRVCFWNKSVHALCIMLWFTSQSSCIIYERPSYKTELGCPTGMHLQHTLENCFSLHTQPYWIALLTNTHSCMQAERGQSISCLPK